MLAILAVPLACPVVADGSDGARTLSLSTVSLTDQGGTVTVRVSVDGSLPRYTTRVLAAPVRVVVDLHGTAFAWRGGPIRPIAGPVREIRGSQWAPGIARVVVELTERVAYRIEPGEDGIAVVLERAARAETVAPTPAAPAPAPPAGAPGAVARPTGAHPTVALPAADRVDASRQPTPAAEVTTPTHVQAPIAPAPSAPSAPPSPPPPDWSLRGYVEAGARFYLNERDEGLEDDGLPLEALLDLRYRLGSDTLLRLRPRLAIDPLISSRNRYEPLDAYVEHETPYWSLLAGQAVENWAIVDTFNPVDVLNRRDLERDFYDPERLGEVMLRLRGFLPDAGAFEQPTLSLYFLPLHRETPLPSDRDRFRFDATGDGRGDLRDDAIVASPDVAYAARLSASVRGADLFLFYFGGPSRIPSLDVSFVGDVTPVYYLVDMVGGGGQWALGPWLLKAEAAQTFTKTAGLRRQGRAVVPPDFFQYVVGIDRTFSDVLGKNEVTVTLEYAGEDDPDQTTLEGLRPFKSDVFLGVRWAFHDVRRTEFQVSVSADVLVDEQLWLVKFGTTLYRDVRLLVVGQLVNRAPRNGADRLTPFNVFPNNSNIWIALRYEF